jgi:hypothetical protein
MHQPLEQNKIFSLGDIVELDNGMPDFEGLVGVGIVISINEDDVEVHWHSDVWLEGRTQKMKACEIRHAHLL